MAMSYKHCEVLFQNTIIFGGRGAPTSLFLSDPHLFFNSHRILHYIAPRWPERKINWCLIDFKSTSLIIMFYFYYKQIYGIYEVGGTTSII
jgi:hypothetical protein